MKFTPIVGIVLLAAGIITLLALHTTPAGLILILAGAGTLLASIFRRHGRPGDYNKSGITGIN